MEQTIFTYIAFNVLASSIGSVLGYKWDDILLVNVENVSNVTKLILIIFYIVIFKNTELPNSFFIRFASKNEALLDRINQKIKESEKIIVVKIIADVSWLCAWTFG